VASENLVLGAGMGIVVGIVTGGGYGLGLWTALGAGLGVTLGAGCDTRGRVGRPAQSSPGLTGLPDGSARFRPSQA
jgi:hypothetical protein